MCTVQYSTVQCRSQVHDAAPPTRIWYLPSRLPEYLAEGTYYILVQVAHLHAHAVVLAPRVCVNNTTENNTRAFQQGTLSFQIFIRYRRPANQRLPRWPALSCTYLSIRYASLYLRTCAVRVRM